MPASASVDINRNGAIIPISWTVKNGGDAISNGHYDRLMLVDSSGTPVPGSEVDILVNNYTDPDTLPGKSYTISFGSTDGLRIPTIPTGDYAVVVQVDKAFGGSVAESNETNNDISQPIRITEVRADLEPVAGQLIAPNTVSVDVNTNGTRIPISWTVKNIGDGTSSGHRDQLWLEDSSGNQVPGTLVEITVNNYVFDPATPPGQTYTISFNAAEGFLVPDLPSGQYSLVLRADMDPFGGSITEWNENNNTIRRPITVTRGRPEPHSDPADGAGIGHRRHQHQRDSNPDQLERAQPGHLILPIWRSRWRTPRPNLAGRQQPRRGARNVGSNRYRQLLEPRHAAGQ